MQLARNRVVFFWQFHSHHNSASKGSMQHWLLLNFSFLTTEMYVFNYKGDTGEPNLSFATPLWFSEFSPCSIDLQPCSNQDRQLWTAVSSKVIKGFADFGESK